MSKFQKQNLVKVLFHFETQQKTKSSEVVFDVVLAHAKQHLNLKLTDI